MIGSAYRKIGQMKTQNKQSNVLILIVMAAVEIVRVSGTGSCNPAVLKRFGWCEQWACADNCTCMEKPDCRQYCDGYVCRDMRCLSPSICKQKVHLNGSIRPRVLNMFARAPFVTQDCSGGTCDVMRAKGPKGHRRGRKNRKRNENRKNKRKINNAVKEGKATSNAALQNCVEGKCKRLVSTLKISKQFCSHCTKMHCFGAHATNCTQICAIGKCENVHCNAKDCQQACLQNSTCKLKCGKSVKTCLQVCEEGSICDMTCEAESCKQVCGDKKGCRILKKASSRTTTTSLPTTRSPITSTHANELISKMYSNNLTLEQSKLSTSVSSSKARTTATTKSLTTPSKTIPRLTLANGISTDIKTMSIYKNSSSSDKEPLDLSSRNSANNLKAARLQVLALALYIVLGLMTGYLE